MAARKPRIRKTAEQLAAEALARRAQDFEAANLPGHIAGLAQHDNVEVARKATKRGEKVVEENSARRLDAFEALKAGMVAGAYDAARRFETDILIRRGENDKGTPTGRVDRTAGLTSDAIIQAAQRIEAVIDRLPPRDHWLLCELIAPSVDRDGIQPKRAKANGEIEEGPPLFGWRAHAYYITGERHSEGQASAVRSACTNLRDAYTAIERKAA